MNIDSVFIECLKLPVFARMEYLESEQIKSKFQKETFLKILYDKWRVYKSIVFKEDLEKPFDDLVKEKGWDFAAITVYGDEPEPFEHIYSEIELNEIDAENIFKNISQNNFDWLDEKVLWLIKDYIYKLYEKWDSEAFEGLEMRKVTNPPQRAEMKSEQKQPKTFEDLFYNPEHAEICLSILRELQPPAIDAKNNYIGKAKGVFPLWINVLKTHKFKPFIKHFPDKIYKRLLNDKVKGLSLSKDASEFRKHYKRLEKNNTKLDIKTILSQYSQSGKLGK